MKYSLFFLFLFLSQIIIAQRNTYLEAGFSSSRFTSFSNDYSYIDNKWSPQIYLMFRRPLIKHVFNYQFGVGYQRIGESYDQVKGFYNAQYPEINLPPALYFSERYNLMIRTLKIPVSLEYCLLGFRFSGGIYLAKNYNGKFWIDQSFHTSDHRPLEQQETLYKSMEEDGVFYSDKVKSDIKSELIHYGYTLALGYKVKRYGFVIKYEEGLSNIEHRGIALNENIQTHFESIFSNQFIDPFSFDETSRMKLRSFSINLTYDFN